MKPNQLRALRKHAELEQAARSDRLQAYLEGDGPLDAPVQGLVPTEADRDKLERQIRKVGRRAEAQPAFSPRRQKLIDELIGLVAQLVVVERVLGMDPLLRAALTPRSLMKLSLIEPNDLHAKLREIMAGMVGGGDAPQVVLPGGVS